MKVVSSDELHTLDGDEFPKEWWVRDGIERGRGSQQGPRARMAGH